MKKEEVKEIVEQTIKEKNKNDITEIPTGFLALLNICMLGFVIMLLIVIICKLFGYL